MINPFVRKIILLGDIEIADAIQYLYPEFELVGKFVSVEDAIALETEDENNLIICCANNDEALFDELTKNGFKKGREFIGFRRLVEWLDIYNCNHLSRQIQGRIKKDGIICWGDEIETSEFEYFNHLMDIERIPVAERKRVLSLNSFIVITSWEYTSMVSFLEQHNRKEGRDFIFYKQLRDDMRPSQMFWSVLEDKRKYLYLCDAPFNYTQIESGGNVKFCCLGLRANSGNLNDISFRGAWESKRARIIRWSVLAGKYTFCDSEYCPYLSNPKRLPYAGINTTMKEMTYPKMLNLSTDHTCNLYCDHCRDRIMVADNQERCDIEHLNEIIREELLPHIDRLLIAGNGEVFFSRAYRGILEDEKVGSENLEVAILSNGQLFDKEHFENIKIKHKSIGVSISIDASTFETYKKIRRGGDFNKLKKNLHYISSLRNNGDIKHFQINFVVRSDNVSEMGDFVEFGRELQVDTVRFVRLENWIFDKKEFLERDIFSNKSIKEEYRDLFNDERLLDPIVDFRNIEKYL